MAIKTTEPLLGGKIIFSPSGVKIETIEGSPEGVITAPIGSIVIDKDTGTRYIKASGIGNTGWQADAGFDSEYIGTTKIWKFPESTVPNTFIILDGRTYLKADWSEGWAWAIANNLVTNNESVYNANKTLFYEVNSTSFRPPADGGYYYRGLDASGLVDPNGVNKTVGSVYNYLTAIPTTPFTTNTTGAHTHGVQGQDIGELGTGTFAIGSGSGTQSGSAGAHSHTITAGGDNETSPKHIVVLYIMKFKTRVPLMNEIVAGDNVSINTQQVGNKFQHVINAILPNDYVTPSQLPNPNYFLNSNFGSRQKGISYTTTGSGNEMISADEIYVRRQDGSVNNIATTLQLANGVNLLKVQRIVGDTNTASYGAMQVLDSKMVQQTLAGKNACISFKAFHGAQYSSATPIKCRVYGSTTAEDLTATPFGFTGGTVLGNYDLPLINTTIASFDFFFAVASDIKSIAVVWEQSAPQGTAGTIDGFYLGEIKIEEGSEPTKFVHKTDAECLQEIEPFIERIQGENANSTTGTIAFADGISTLRTPIKYAKKRKIPSIVVNRQNAFNILRNSTDLTTTAISFTTIQKYAARMDITTTGGSMAGGEANMPNLAAATDYIEIRASNVIEGL